MSTLQSSQESTGGHSTNVWRRFADVSLKTCPECAGVIQRLLGAGAAVLFKGSGFHATDYRQPQTRCGQDRPCCGWATTCDTPPCND